MTGEFSAIKRWLVGMSICALSIIASIIWIDRPVADFVHGNLLQLDFVQEIASLMDFLAAFAALAMIFLFACGLWTTAGRKLARWTELPLSCSWALVWGIAAAEAAKQVFGRSDPDMWTGMNPGEPHLGIYHFNWIHGIHGYESFPSGTTTAATSILAVLWISVPRFRILWAALLAFVVASLLVTNSHFVSDVIAGGFLGATIGWMTLQLRRKGGANY